MTNSLSVTAVLTTRAAFISARCTIGFKLAKLNILKLKKNNMKNKKIYTVFLCFIITAC